VPSLQTVDDVAQRRRAGRRRTQVGEQDLPLDKLLDETREGVRGSVWHGSLQHVQKFLVRDGAPRELEHGADWCCVVHRQLLCVAEVPHVRQH
jgi:hypothetical protein